MTRKRSAYRPRPVSLDPLKRLQPAPKATVDDVMLRFNAAFHMIAAGQHPGVDEWRDLSDAINSVEALTLDMGLLDIDATMPDVRAATEAMIDAAQRYRAGRSMAFDGPGLRAVRSVLDIYEQAARGFTQHVMTSAVDIVARKVREAQRGSSDRVVAL